MKSLLVFYSHFSPAYKAGGPVQSLVNMVDLLHEDFNIYIVCSAYEMGEAKTLQGIVPDEWNDYQGKAKVFYISRSPLSAIWNSFRAVSPDLAYINGLFLFVYSVVPILFARLNHVKIVLAPRGMLQHGALSVRRFKKKVFLVFFKFLTLMQKIQWHATDGQELDDIRKEFGNTSGIRVLGNIPKVCPSEIARKEKSPGTLKMIFLSVISAKKNLDLILKALKQIDTPVFFDIYGPIKDQDYWLKCERLIKDQKHRIRYLGPVDPSQVQDILSHYHVFVLPTKGENFGHAIYEAFSVGTPVIISKFTPWGLLEQTNSGITINLEDLSSLTNAISRFITMGSGEFFEMSQHARQRALGYSDASSLRDSYKSLFNFNTE